MWGQSKFLISTADFWKEVLQPLCVWRKVVNSRVWHKVSKEIGQRKSPTNCNKNFKGLEVKKKNCIKVNSICKASKQCSLNIVGLQKMLAPLPHQLSGPFGARSVLCFVKCSLRTYYVTEDGAEGHSLNILADNICTRHLSDL